ncbi:MAG: hypothetical protein R2838_25665 [Caldilineaceae bacterium]
MSLLAGGLLDAELYAGRLVFLLFVPIGSAWALHRRDGHRPLRRRSTRSAGHGLGWRSSPGCPTWRPSGSVARRPAQPAAQYWRRPPDAG